MQWGLDNKVEKFEATLNSAAEEACKTAAPIFINAIKNMSLEDGFSILKGKKMLLQISYMNKQEINCMLFFFLKLKKLLKK